MGGIPSLETEFFLLQETSDFAFKTYGIEANPWTEEPGRLQSMGSLGVGQD